MTYAVRIRLYKGSAQAAIPGQEPEADTDPDARDGAPGSERAPDLEDVGQVLRELAQAFHGPGAELIAAGQTFDGLGLQIIGLSDMALGPYLTLMREHIGKTHALTYQQSYRVRGVGPFDDPWFARVDVHRAIAP